jgi:dienelactone hydrolase
VGLRLIERLDAGRISARFPTGRPIQIVFWYPAGAPGRALTYRDYLVLSAMEISFGPATAAVASDAAASWRGLLATAGATPQDADSFLELAMRATRDAVPRQGRLPLVLIAQGNGQSACDQAFLAELLASRGYAVATVPSQARIGGPMTSDEDIPAHAEAQAADLAFALRVLRSEPQVRSGAYAIVAHSFGARSALLLAMGDPDAGALVSLDGGIGGKAGKGLLETSRRFDRARATVPILHLYEDGDRFMVPDFDLLRSLTRADRWLVKVDGMRHVHFSSLGIAVRSIPSLAKVTSADERTSAAWDAVAAATVSFLDSCLAVETTETNTCSGWTTPASPLLHSRFLKAEPTDAAR